MTQAPTADIVKGLRDELTATKKALRQAEDRVAALSPTVDISEFLFETPEDVSNFFGEKRLEQMVKDRIASENKRLNRQGYDRIQYSAESIAEITEELLQSFVDDRAASQPPDEGWLTRTIKLKAPDGRLVQVVYEGQVNNTAGSLADGLLRYERKGFKRTNPMLCPSRDCWEPAAIGTSGKLKGKWTFVGYCSQDHFDRTEAGQGDKIPVSE